MHDTSIYYMTLTDDLAFNRLDLSRLYKPIHVSTIEPFIEFEL